MEACVMRQDGARVAVVGGGPAGLVAVIASARRGWHSI